MLATISIRAARGEDAPGIARVHLASWQTTYRGIVPDDILDHLTLDDYEPRWRQLLASAEIASGVECTFVAEEVATTTIIGFAHGAPTRSTRSEAANTIIQRVPYESELNAIYLLPTMRRQGIGRRLTAAVAQHLAARGHHGLIVWALADNAPARRFYERLGGVVVAEQPIEIGKPLVEVAYGWPDLPPSRTPSPLGHRS
mgnify:CR=1 FL=1